VKFITRIITRVRQHGAYRFGSRTARIAAALLAVSIVATLTVDLGPAVRGWAERQGSKQLKRPIHIGAVHLRLLTGAVVVSDLSIDGLRPTDRPFFSARRLEVTLNWWTLLRKEVTVETVNLSDWRMVVEKWADRHNFPKLGGGEENEPERPKRFTTTLRLVRATKGEFIYDDHEKPWSVVAPNLEIAVTGVAGYHGEAIFNGGRVTIQDYVPMWANMHAWFTIEKSRIGEVLCKQLGIGRGCARVARFHLFCDQAMQMLAALAQDGTLSRSLQEDMLEREVESCRPPRVHDQPGTDEVVNRGS